MPILPAEHKRIRQVIVSFEHWRRLTCARLTQLDHRYVCLVVLVNKLLEEDEVFPLVPHRERIRPELVFRRNQIIEAIETVVWILCTRFEAVGERPLIEEEPVTDLGGSIIQSQLTQPRQELCIGRHFV